jgi:hypothetical protein
MIFYDLSPALPLKGREKCYLVLKRFVAKYLIITVKI